MAWIRPALRAGLSDRSPWVEKTRHLLHVTVVNRDGKRFQENYEFFATAKEAHALPEEVRRCGHPRTPAPRLRPDDVAQVYAQAERTEDDRGWVVHVCISKL